MTTHDQRIAAEPAGAAELETSSAQTEVPVTHDEQNVPAPEAQTVPRSADVQPTDADVRPTDDDVRPTDADVQPTDADVQPTDADVQPTDADVQPTDNENLFATDPSGLRSRWDDIQAAFVDDPPGCVQMADGLVEEVIEQLTSRFADARAQLEAQWARGEIASTEDLRVALTRYREFFQRLLAV